MRVNGNSGDSVAIGAKGNITIINSKIFRSGKTAAEIIGTGHTWADKPYFVVGVAAEYLTIIDSTFDGYDKSKGSSAEIAMLLDIPVILVVNAKSVAYSVAPLIYGFKHFNPKLKIAGVVFNMVASENHFSFYSMEYSL